MTSLLISTMLTYGHQKTGHISRTAFHTILILVLLNSSHSDALINITFNIVSSADPELAVAVTNSVITNSLSAHAVYVADI